MNDSTKRWKAVKRDRPCPVCGHGDNCKVSADGGACLCWRTASDRPCKGAGGWIHKLRDDRDRPAGGAQVGRRPGGGPGSKPAATTAKTDPNEDVRGRPPGAGARRDWGALHRSLAEKLTPERLEALSVATGVPAAAWAALSPGWADVSDLRGLKAWGAGWGDAYPDGAWAVPERDGAGRVVGLSLRATDGRKGAPAGCGRGLVVPAKLRERGGGGPVLVVEGASDVAACVALGLPAVGRPSNTGGAEHVAALLEGEDLLVVGERDAKDDGRWPGKTGAIEVAKSLAGRRDGPVGWTLPPEPHKDIRAYLNAGAGDGKALLEMLKSAAREVEASRRSQAETLVELARSRYRLGKSTDGEAFAVPLEGPAVVRGMRREGGLRMELAKAYRTVTGGKVPGSQALSDALAVLEGEADDAGREKLWVRVANVGDGGASGGVALDLGTATGEAAVVTPGGWAVGAVPPVLFQRGALTGALPVPERAEPAGLLGLRGLLNVTDDAWSLVVGWLVAAMMPDPPHPILALFGEQGTGKTTAAPMIVRLVDPSPVEVRSEPKDAEQWAVAAAGSWVVCIDNVSRIGEWLSDTLCKAVTGDGLIRRKLYTDGDVSVLAYKRALILTSIDAGAMRGDLGDRLLLLDLERIPDEKRRTEAELWAAFGAALPTLLGSLLSAVSRTLAELPKVKLAGMPRMADFAVVLAALDTACPELTGGRALSLFTEQRQRITEDVLESDAVASAVRALAEAEQEWEGTAGELLTRITPEHRPAGWPKNARRLVGHLKRVTPALRAVGVFHTPPAKGDKLRTHRLEMRGERPPEPPEPVPGRSETPGGVGGMGGMSPSISYDTDPTTETPHGTGTAGPSDAGTCWWGTTPAAEGEADDADAARASFREGGERAGWPKVSVPGRSGCSVGEGRAAWEAFAEHADPADVHAVAAALASIPTISDHRGEPNA